MMTSHMKRLVLFLALTALCGVPARPAAQPPPHSVAIALAGDHFQVEYDNSGVKQAKFLTFISYFDGLRASPAVLAEDLDYIKSIGFDGIRVLPNWQLRGRF